jgi:hypothetical protein
MHDNASSPPSTNLILKIQSHRCGSPLPVRHKRTRGWRSCSLVCTHKMLPSRSATTLFSSLCHVTTAGSAGFSGVPSLLCISHPLGWDPSPSYWSGGTPHISADEWEATHQCRRRCCGMGLPLADQTNQGGELIGRPAPIVISGQ